ncbi:glutathione transferase GstA [Pendulispora albinea]|uniref:Glutathione transferase GstA n=1 Tax=Pendulispora albinea TaxID=2741071 RepID=A0ABZ2LY78_9BACT
MKLYLAPKACSFAPHIILRELGIPFETETVNLGTKKTRSGEDFYTINPKGKVPALRLDNGEVLTEAAVILQYLADLKPEANLIPKAGSWERVRLQEWLHYTATEIHKQFNPLWRPDSPEATKKTAIETIVHNYGLAARHLDERPYLVGDRFTIADAYLFNFLEWNKMKGPALDIAQWPSLQAFDARISARPAVRAALDAEAAFR